MGVQQHRRTKSRIRSRRAQIMKLETPSLVNCPQCHELTQSHTVCPSCGYYKNRVVVVKKED